MPISFQNRGEIDPRLITAVGVNVKEGESPIGYFGTGLKYAIAVLLREGCEVEIWSGLEKFEFGLRQETIRGKDFQFITMNGVQLAFTTEYGKNWTIENAYRELYCNATDEGGGVVETSRTPFDGETLVMVEGESFEEAHRNRDKFLLNPNRKPLFVLEGVGEIYAGSSSAVFYRGVAAGKASNASSFKFTYNILEKSKLTEDRTLANDWDMRKSMAKLLGACDQRYVLFDSLKDENGGEKHFYFEYTEPGDLFYSVVGELIQTHRHDMNKNAFSWYCNKKGKPKPQWRKIVMNEEERELLAKVLRFWAQLDHQISDYQIHLVTNISESQSGKILACAEDEQIWLTPECFRREEHLSLAVFEEYVHLRFHVEDETRAMQNVLFAEIKKLGEQIVRGR